MAHKKLRLAPLSYETDLLRLEKLFPLIGNVPADRLMPDRIEDLHFHDIRHTFASRLVMAGVDIRTVQTLLGHKSIAMTEKYAHLADDHRQAAVEKMNPPEARA